MTDFQRIIHEYHASLGTRVAKCHWPAVKHKRNIYIYIYMYILTTTIITTSISTILLLIIIPMHSNIYTPTNTHTTHTTTTTTTTTTNTTNTTI